MAGKLQTILGAIARQVTEEFDSAKWVQHPGESGRAREAMIRTFLERVMPPDFGIDTGFVLDASDDISKQIDIVVYRKSRAPVLDIGGVKHFMVENVAAVIEVKATIGDNGVLTSALDNIASVKRLDRTGNGLNSVVGLGQYVAMDQTGLHGQILGAIFAGTSMNAATVLDTIVNWQRDHRRREWPNHYIDLRRYMIRYLETDSAGDLHVSFDPNIASGIAALDTSSHDEMPIPPLAMFATNLLEFLSITPEIDYRKAGYFTREVIARDEAPFEYDTEFEGRAQYGNGRN